MFRPELLVPAGHVEALFAAIEGGADAVYFGLPSFSARKRAENFQPGQHLALQQLAAQHRIKLYLTLNTLVKNDEIPELLDSLSLASRMKLDGVIIQDWGVYHLLRHFFPDIPLHASTQMGFHNSPGVTFAKASGFERVILARELTAGELETLRGNTDLELEIFVHGALCYSFSGNCLFSSYLGGMSANRGNCRQPCRRLYTAGESSETQEPGRQSGKEGSLFNLRDLELLEHVPRLREMKIDALKVEGRMKSAEYVWKVSRAYRMVLDDPNTLPEARKILREDLGREKTSWFFGNTLNKAMAPRSYTGLFIGEVETVEQTAPDTGGQPMLVTFRSNHALGIGDRLRILPGSSRDSKAFKLQTLFVEGEERSEAAAGERVTVSTALPGIVVGDPVLLAESGSISFPNKLPRRHWEDGIRMSKSKKARIDKSVPVIPAYNTKDKYIFRIDRLGWLPKTYLQSLDTLIMDLPLPEWEAFDPSRPLIKKNMDKFVIALPLFIPEGRCADYKKLLAKLVRDGFRQFLLQQPGQKNLLPDQKDRKYRLWAGEYCYSLNDAALAALQAFGFSRFVLPFENDMDNLLGSRSRAGTVPLYFYPRLFYSRMPVAGGAIADKTGQYQVRKREGMTVVIPEMPVSWLHKRKFLSEQGYHSFLIDLSHEKPSQNTFNRLLKKAKQSEREQPSTHFNLGRGLK